jgi:hypothetical protein
MLYLLEGVWTLVTMNTKTYIPKRRSDNSYTLRYIDAYIAAPKIVNRYNIQLIYREGVTACFSRQEVNQTFL